MIKGSKICGISDLDTLNFIINHPYPPQFIGFICNYKKSSRYVEFEQLKKLLTLDKKKSNFVAVLVKPDEDILEKIKHLPFNYYQIYDCTPDEIKSIKEKFKIPVFAYQVSGEYSLISNGIQKKLVSEDVILESLLAFKRAGANAIVSYYADRIDKILK